jgi:RNA polymerase sigma-70 factor (ECF subfamily)
MSRDTDFESLVNTFYPALYRFAFSLTRIESDARDRPRDVLHLGGQRSSIADARKVKSWLFATLHREYLGRRRKSVRFPHLELTQAEDELPEISPVSVDRLDGALALDALARLDEAFQGPVALFYLEDYTYPEIAEILEIPLGTVKSRISRGITQLQRLIQCPKRSLRKATSVNRQQAKRILTGYRLVSTSPTRRLKKRFVWPKTRS